MIQIHGSIMFDKIRVKQKIFTLDQQIARHFFFTNPLPFYATQIINHFLNSRSSANHDKGLEFYPIGNPYMYLFMF